MISLKATISYSITNEDFEKMVNSKKSARTEAEHYILNHSCLTLDRNERSFLFESQLINAIKIARKNNIKD